LFFWKVEWAFGAASVQQEASQQEQNSESHTFANSIEKIHLILPMFPPGREK
jgi:pyoverdine/dityrosine biosynthesis protein Dit1